MKGETTPRPARPPEAALSPAAALVRRHDRERYRTALFAPAARREALFALYAFNYEIARVREAVSQPMLGQIRLQWWREVIDAAFAGGPARQHEVVAPLTAAIRDLRLSRAPFDRMIDARELDLADEPPATLAALEEYAAGTAATVVRLALEILGVREPAAEAAGREVGIAYALAGLLRAMPFRARTGLPSIAAALAPAEIAAAARRHLDAAQPSAARVTRAARSALLPSVIAGHYLKRLRRAGDDPFAAALQKPDPLQVWRLAFAMTTGRL